MLAKNLAVLKHMLLYAKEALVKTNNTISVTVLLLVTLIAYLRQRILSSLLALIELHKLYYYINIVSTMKTYSLPQIRLKDA